MVVQESQKGKLSSKLTCKTNAFISFIEFNKIACNKALTISYDL